MTLKLASAVLLIAMVAIGILMLATQQTITPTNPSDWVPLNNGYPGWSNKVQPF